MNETSLESSKSTGRLREVAAEFVRLGLVAYGGPAAHIAMMEERFVRKKQWLSRERFLDLVGAVNLLPGPSSTELAIYLGELRAGVAGLVVAGAGFIFPAAAMAAVLAWVYVRYGAAPQLGGLLFGIKPIVVALIAEAVWNLARTALKSAGMAALAVVVLMLAALHAPTIALLVGTGVVWMLLRERRRMMGGQGAFTALAGMGAAGAAPSVGLLPLGLYFLKIGALLFGSGYVLLAVLQADLVGKYHWLTGTQLIDAVAVSQATPGPFFTVATFLGYVLGGWRGAGVATLGMFLPAFVYVGATANFLPRLRKQPAAGAFLDGVNAAAVALMAYVAWQFASAAVVNVASLALAIVGAALVFVYRVNSAWLVAGGAVAGIALRALGWA